MLTLLTLRVSWAGWRTVTPRSSDRPDLLSMKTLLRSLQKANHLRSHRRREATTTMMMKMTTARPPHLQKPPEPLTLSPVLRTAQGPHPLLVSPRRTRQLPQQKVEEMCKQSYFLLASTAAFHLRFKNKTKMSRMAPFSFLSCIPT